MGARTNLKVLKRQAAPHRGEVFMMQLCDSSWLFGRVILAGVPQNRAPMPGANLIYIYAQQSQTPEPDHAQLRPDRLLISPLWTNNLPWTKGYFQTIEKLPITKFDLLRQHCFHRVPVRVGGPGKFVDEAGRELSGGSEPCGEWSLVSYRWIDDHISDAVGIPRVPEE